MKILEIEVPDGCFYIESGINKDDFARVKVTVRVGFESHELHGRHFRITSLKENAKLWDGNAIYRRRVIKLIVNKVINRIT